MTQFTHQPQTSAICYMLDFRSNALSQWVITTLRSKWLSFNSVLSNSIYFSYWFLGIQYATHSKDIQINSTTCAFLIKLPNLPITETHCLSLRQTADSTNILLSFGDIYSFPPNPFFLLQFLFTSILLMSNAPLPIPPLSIFGITPKMPLLSRRAFHSPGTKLLELETSDPCDSHSKECSLWKAPRWKIWDCGYPRGNGSRWQLKMNRSIAGHSHSRPW